MLIIEKTSHVSLTYDTLGVPDSPLVTLGTVHRAYENAEKMESLSQEKLK
jgi:hypothetical protein